jgi:hypothetical protein
MPVIEKCFIGEAELDPKEFKMYIQPIYDALCNTDKLKTYEAIVKFIEWKNDQLDYTKITDIEVDGINTLDFPDFADSYISSFTYKGRDATDEELEILNEDGDFVYECVQDSIF